MLATFAWRQLNGYARRSTGDVSWTKGPVRQLRSKYSPMTNELSRAAKYLKSCDPSSFLQDRQQRKVRLRLSGPYNRIESPRWLGDGYDSRCELEARGAVDFRSTLSAVY